MSKSKSTTSTIRSSAVEYLAFIATNCENGVEAFYDDENIWLSQKMMATLYDVTVSTINQHLKRIYTVVLRHYTVILREVYTVILSEVAGSRRNNDKTLRLRAG